MPTDEQTGLPLPIFYRPNTKAPPEVRPRDLRFDYDHAWFEHSNPGLRETGNADLQRGGLVLRYSYGQVLPRWLHVIKNRRYAEPSTIPEVGDWHAQFRMAVMGCARLVGPYALVLTSDNWTNKWLMTPAQHAWLTDPQRMHIEMNTPKRERSVRTAMGKFFAAYALEQDLWHVTPRVIKDFLRTKNPAHRRELGNYLLRETLVVALDPIAAIKDQIADEYDMPLVRRANLVKRVIGYFPENRFPEYHDTIAQRLETGAMAWAA